MSLGLSSDFYLQPARRLFAIGLIFAVLSLGMLNLSGSAQEIEMRRRADAAAVTKADQLLKTGKATAAEAILKEFLALHPGSASAQLRLAEIAIRRWDFKSAQQTLEQVLAREPGNLDALAELGHLYYVQATTPVRPVDRIVKAESLLTQAIRLNPEHVKTLVYLGELALYHHDLVTAERHYRRALSNSPTYMPAHQGLTRYYIEVKDYIKARETITQALELDPGNASNYFLVAELMAVADHPAEAVKYAEQSESLDFGRNLNRDYFLATRLEKLGENQKAVAYYQRILSEYPEHHESWMRLGQLYETLKQPAQSAQAYRKAISLNPGYLEELKQQARQATRLDNWPGALENWRRVEALTPPGQAKPIQDIRAAIVLAQQWQGNPPYVQPGMMNQTTTALPVSTAVSNTSIIDAVTSAESSALSTTHYVKSNAGYGGSAIDQLQAMFLAGRLKESRDWLDGIDGLSEDAYQMAGDRMLVVGHYLAARTFYQRALELLRAEGAPHPQAKESLAAILQRIDQKEKTAQRLVDEGNLLYENKSYAPAAEKYLAALRTYPHSETAYLRLGDTYERLKQRPNAYWAYHQAIELNPTLLDSKGFMKKYSQLQKVTNNASK